MQYPFIYQTTPRRHILQLQLSAHNIEFPQLLELTQKLGVLEDSGFTQPIPVLQYLVWGCGEYAELAFLSFQTDKQANFASQHAPASASTGIGCVGMVKRKSSSTDGFCVSSKSWDTSSCTLHLWDVST